MIVDFLRSRGQACRGAAIVLSAIACNTPFAAQAAGWSPQKNIEIVVGTAPGSGVDRPARIIQNIIEDKRLIDATVTVVNKPGAGGAIAYTYIRQRPGDAHSVVLASPTLVTNHITGKRTLHHSDLTALALLASEYVSFAVRNDSPIRTAQDLRDALKRDPKSLAIGIGTSVSNNNHMAIAQFAKYIGADVAQLKAVAFRAPDEVTTALMGGHLDAMALAASNIVSHLRGGKIRVIALAAPTRSEGALAAIPTLKEQGFDVVTRQWRAFFAPKGLTPAQLFYREGTLARVVQTEQWQTYLEGVANESTYLNGKDTEKFLAAEYDELRTVLREIGLAK